MLTSKIVLAAFAILFGIFLILDGAFGWGLARIVRPAPRWEIRISEIIIGVIFIILAILTFAGVI